MFCIYTGKDALQVEHCVAGGLHKAGALEEAQRVGLGIGQADGAGVAAGEQGAGTFGRTYGMAPM